MSNTAKDGAVRALVFELIEATGCAFYLGAALEALANVAISGGIDKRELLARAEEFIARQRELLGDEQDGAESTSEPEDEPEPVVENARSKPWKPKRAKGGGRKSTVDVDELAETVETFFANHPGASWREAFEQLDTPYKSCSSMQASLRTRVNRKAKPRKVAGKQFVDKWHKKTLAEAEAAAREENGAA